MKAVPYELSSLIATSVVYYIQLLLLRFYVIFKDSVWRLLFQNGILLFSSGKRYV